jgi:hypothetical protein
MVGGAYMLHVAKDKMMQKAYNSMFFFMTHLNNALSIGDSVLFLFIPFVILIVSDRE